MRALPMKAVFALTTTLATAFVFTPSAMAGMHGASYNVELNKMQVLHLSQPAGAIIVGNPEIADVSVHSSDTIFLVGRGYGETNILILNGAGETVMNADVQVINTLSRNGVRLYNGADARRTYSCAPYCQPAPVLGDEGAFIGQNTKGAPAINNQVATSAFGLSANGQPVAQMADQ